MNLHINETGIENLNIYNSNIDDVDILYAAWHIICEVYAAIKNHTTNPVYECDYDDMKVINNLREALNRCAVHGSKAAITTISFLRKQILIEKLGECINMLFDEWSKYGRTMPEPSMAYCNKVFRYAIKYNN